MISQLKDLKTITLQLFCPHKRHMLNSKYRYALIKICMYRSNIEFISKWGGSLTDQKWEFWICVDEKEYNIVLSAAYNIQYIYNKCAVYYIKYICNKFILTSEWQLFSNRSMLMVGTFSILQKRTKKKQTKKKAKPFD